MRRGYFYGVLLFVTACCLPAARAQSNFDLNIGFGTAHDSSNGLGLDNLNSALNPLGPCNPNGLDPNCEKTGALSNFFLGFGGDVLLGKRYGFGAEVTFQPARPDYGPLIYRQTFYDFNGILAPINEKRVQLQIQGGIGGSRTSFSINQSGCIGVAVACSTQVVPVANANHFQIHVGVGVQLFVTEHLFVRPQFDFHYVPSFTDQFNSTAVPGFMVWVGYGWH